MEKVFLSDVLKAIKKAYIWNDDISQQILEKEIKQLPSAQPEIVRCKDCKFGNISSMGHLAVCGHEKGLVDPVPDSYCSYAERRTDE